MKSGSWKIKSKDFWTNDLFLHTPDPLRAACESEWNKLIKSRLYQAVNKESRETPVLWFKSTLIEKYNIVSHNFIASFSFTNFRKFSLILCAPQRLCQGAQDAPSKAELFPGFCCRQYFGTSFSGRWASQQCGRMKFPPCSNHLPPFPLPK